MDVLSDLLRQARVRNAVVRKVIQRPPWSFHLADPEPLTAVAVLEASFTIVPADGTAHVVEAGGVGLVKGGGYTIADSAATPCQVVIRNGQKSAPDGGVVADQTTAPRTYGEPEPGAVTVLHGIYELHGSAGDRLLRLLPPVTTVAGGPRTSPLLEFLAAEATRDEPGQDAVLQRLLDLILVVALRSWGTDVGWLGAIADPALGRVLELLHGDPQRRWTTAALAREAGMSRAAFSARFSGLVGEPPMAYLTGWRMTLASDLLRSSDVTVAAVARAVGYDNASSFSTAFKRAFGVSPGGWRQG